MTPTQCRMARAALEWRTTDLARAANIGANTVNRFETGRDARISTVEKLRSALEAAGVVFIAENGGGAGVRFHETKTRKQTGA
jgi:transcriptional regulator with XRE-family HTH domain